MKKSEECVYRTRMAGFTLVELLVVIAVIAILVTIGIPSFRDTIKNNRVTSHTNELLATLHFAKSEAVRRSAPVDVRLRDIGAGWEASVFFPSGTSGTENCLRCSTNRRVSLQADDGTGLLDPPVMLLVFNSRGYLADSMSNLAVVPQVWLEHDECSGERQRRRISILPSGQLLVANVGCSS